MAITQAHGAGTYGVTISAPVSTHTKGSWTELLASTSEAIAAILPSVSNANAGSQKYLWDVGTGAGGAEAVLIADMPFHNGSNFNINCTTFYLPITIATSTRLAARCQASGASSTMEVSATLVGGTGTAAPTTYGAVTASSNGTQVDPGGSANTKGSYAQVTASTSATHTWWIVLIASRGNANPAGALFALDVATGAGGAETVVIPDLQFSSNAGADTFNPGSWSVPLSIASGTRIAARAASGTTDATDRLFDVVLIGGTAPTTGGGEHAFAFIG